MSEPVVPENNPSASGDKTPTTPPRPSGKPVPGSGVVRGRHGKPVPRGLVQRRSGYGGDRPQGAEGGHAFSYGTPSDRPDTSRPALPGGARRLDETPISPEVVIEAQTESDNPIGPTSMTAEEMVNAPGTILPQREGRQGRDGGGRRGGRDNRRGDGPPAPARAPQIFTKGFGFGISALRDISEGGLEAELEAAFGGNSAESVLGNANSPDPAPPASPGGYRTGKVVRKHGLEIFISLPGSRAEGLLLLNSLGEAPELGSDVEVRVEGYDAANGLVRLALKGAASTDTDWDNLAVGMLVEARVTGHNAGGLEVAVGNARGFIPASQVDIGRVEKLEAWVNQRLRCVVTRLERSEKNMVLSRRQLLEDERKENAEKTWSTLEVGQIRDGTVRNVMDFGAFVDLGGVDGLIPIREMAWAKVGHPSEIVKVGDVVKVKVLRIDEETRKLSLGLRQLTDNPWDAAVAKLTPGTTIKGRVTKLADFGAFIEIEPGVEGLVHLSELAPHRVRRAGDVVKTGEEVEAVLLAIDLDARRISLSIRGALLAAQGKTEQVEALLAEATPAQPAPPKVNSANLRGGTGGAGPLIPNLFG